MTISPSCDRITKATKGATSCVRFLRISLQKSLIKSKYEDYIGS